jgi:hypothetical protein
MPKGDIPNKTSGLILLISRATASTKSFTFFLRQSSRESFPPAFSYF